MIARIFSLQADEQMREAIRRQLLVIVVPWLLGGCGGPNPSDMVAAMNDSNIRKVANLYMAYQIRHGMMGPKDEAEFKQFIQTEMQPNKLEMMNVDPNNVDALFVSETTGQPFEVSYGLRGSTMAIMAVAYDQPGDNGKRRVGFTNAPVKEVDEQQYEQLKQNPQTKIETAPTEPGK